MSGSSTRRPPTVLVIAGSDSSGGAGIQADGKALAAVGAFGCYALTAVVAGSTTEVRRVHPLPSTVVREQIAAVCADIAIDAVKVGFVGDAATAAAVADTLDDLEATPVVLDPVAVAESGAELLGPSGLGAVRSELLPRASVATPNLAEARLLAGDPTHDPAAAARAVHRLGAATVVVTGGHSEAAVDVAFDGHELARLGGERHPDGAAHGAGCTHSTTLAAALARGACPLAAAYEARRVAGAAVAAAVRGIGHGSAPVNPLAGRFFASEAQWALDSWP